MPPPRKALPWGPLTLVLAFHGLNLITKHPLLQRELRKEALQLAALPP